MHSIERLSEWTLASHAPLCSIAAIRQAKLLLLDAIGCALAAIEAKALNPILEFTAEVGVGKASVIGTRMKVSVPDAVLANSGLIRVLDLNDVVFAERDGRLAVAGHPSDNIAVALAVTEAYGCDAADMLESIALNYEVYGRLRELIPDTSPWDGACASGMAAAAMTGRLLRLDKEHQAHALALAAVRSATPKIVRNGNISATKSLANAMVAQNGAHAALLAAKGVTGPMEILDNRKTGLFQVFDPDRGLDRLWQPVADVPMIMATNLKSYPSIGTSQTAIAAALDARAQIHGHIEDIEAIEVTMADVPVVRHQQADGARAAPKSREAADHSFAFLVAIALQDGELTHRQFEGERWLHDTAVRDLMAKVRLEVSAGLAAAPGANMPSCVRLLMKSGEAVVAQCLAPPGRALSGGGLDARAVEAKFHAVARGLLADPARQAVVATVRNLSGKSDLAKLLGLLSGAA